MATTIDELPAAAFASGLSRYFLQKPWPLQVPDVGGTLQSVAAVAGVHLTEQYDPWLPMKHALLAQSSFFAQVTPKATPPPAASEPPSAA